MFLAQILNQPMFLVIHQNFVFVIRYALVWQDVMNKFGVGSLSAAQQFILLPGCGPLSCNHQTPWSILWTVYMDFHFKSNGWTMQNLVGKYICALQLTNKLQLYLKGAMPLTLFFRSFWYGQLFINTGGAWLYFEKSNTY